MLVDYNQNVWRRTLASVYSVRPKPGATVSTPVTWEEVKRDFRTEDFRIGDVSDRVRKVGELFRPLLLQRGRLKLERVSCGSNAAPAHSRLLTRATHHAPLIKRVTQTEPGGAY